MIFDEPRAVYWDTAGLLVVAYGFHTFGLEAATGESRFEHRSATPIIGLLGSSRLPHVVVQSEIETFAIEADGTVALARRPFRRRDRGGAHRRQSRADRVRRTGQRPGPGHRPLCLIHRAPAAPSTVDRMWITDRGGAKMVDGGR